MTLKSRKVVSSIRTVIIVLSLASSPSAQTPRQRLGTQPPPPEPQQTEEEKKAAKELEKKALALIDEMVADTASLRLAENRVHILTGASDILWTRDEEKARALVREAMDQAVANMREAKEKAAQEDSQYFDSRYPRRYNTTYLRHMVLNLLTRRDPKLALEFLQLTRSLAADNARNTGDFLKSSLQQLVKKYPSVLQNVRGLGMMLGIELSPNIPNLPGDATKTQAARVTNLLHAAGVMVIPAGANVLRLLPALNLSRGEAQEGLNVIESVIAKLAA